MEHNIVNARLSMIRCIEKANLVKEMFEYGYKRHLAEHDKNASNGIETIINALTEDLEFAVSNLD